MNRSYHLLCLFMLLVVLRRTRAGALTDSIYSLIPDACKDSCVAWNNSTMPCIENSGSMSGTYDPVSGNFDFNGNKIAIYFCACSNDAIAKSATCLQCLSTRYCLTPALTSDTYKNVCSGTTSLQAVKDSTKATC